MKSMMKLFRASLAAGMFCLLTSVLSSTFVGASVAPLSFTDDLSNNSNTIIHTGIPEPGNSFKYLISSNVNAVPVPTIETDFSEWISVINGESIVATNGVHIGVVELDSSNNIVDFRDSTAETLLEQTAPIVEADNIGNVISGLTTSMEYNIDGLGYIAYDGLTNPSLAGNHSVLVRMAAEIGVSNASPATSLDFTFANPTPSAPSVVALDDINTVSGLNTSMEYSLDGNAYVMYNGSSLPDLAGNHFMLVRVAENLATDTPAGLTTSLYFTTNMTTPSAPSVSADDDANVIVGIDTTMEFSIDGSMFVAYDGANDPNLVGVHTVLVRVAAVAGISNASSVTTLYYIYANSAPTAPAVTANDAENTIVGLDTTMEFSVDGSVYVKYSGFNAPNLSGVHIVLVRVSENITTDTPVGAYTTLLYTTNLTTPAAPSVTANDFLNTIVGLTTEMEFNIDGNGFEIFDGSNTPNLVGIHTVQVRMAAVPGVSNAGLKTVLIYSYTNPTPTAPLVSADDWNNLIVGLDTTMEYSIDGGEYELFDGINNPDLTGAHFVIVRVAEDQSTDAPVGEITSLVFTTNPIAPVISGVINGAYYDHNIAISYSGPNIISVTLDGSMFVSGSIVAAEGTHTLIVNDSFSGVVTIIFTIDKTNPVVTGVVDGSYYNSDRTITFSDSSFAGATLDGVVFTSGTVVSDEGVYNLVVTDLAGNSTIVNFTIDKTDPVVTGVSYFSYYNSDVTINFSDMNLSGAILDGVPILDGAVISADGQYALLVTDLAGNFTDVLFTIDKTNPSVTSVVDGVYYNGDVNVNFYDDNFKSATLNGDPVDNGDLISTDGNYILVVTDLAGNTTTINFTIDKNSPEVTGVIDGGYYKSDVTINYSDVNIQGATLNGVAFDDGTTVSDEGTYSLEITDLAGNVTIINFVIDKTAPTITGISDGDYSKTDVTITFSDDNLLSATLNGEDFATGTTISDDGTYVLVVTDLAGNSTTVNFIIDQTLPTVTGVTDGAYYDDDVTINFFDSNIDTATLDGTDFISGTTISADGFYTLIVTDLAGNSRIISFTVDKTNPEVTGVTDGVYYNGGVTVSVSDENISTITLNGATFVSGDAVSADGAYVLIATDLAGNFTTVTFTIDKTSPTVTGVADGTFYDSDVTITFNDANIAGAILDGIAFSSGQVVSAEGLHTLVVTDLAGNMATISFTIDKSSPIVTGVTDGMFYNIDVTIDFTDTNISGATLNGSAFTSGSVVSAEGAYILVVTDLAGNETTINFTIDKTAPVITGVDDGEYYNLDVTINFADTNIVGATLDGIAFTDGSIVSAEGNYVLVVTDLAGNTTTINFTIDKTFPDVTGVYDGGYFNTDVTINFSDINLDYAELNGIEYISGTTISADGFYYFIVFDMAGNGSYAYFTIDKTNPTVIGVADGNYYNDDCTITFSDENIDTATLDGAAFVSGSTVSDEGVHTLIVTDLAGNITTVNFTIDKTLPIISGIVDGSFNKTDVTINFSDTNTASATLNGNVFVSGSIVSTDGSYVLIATDLAGNITTVKFTIDKTAPNVVGVLSGTTYDQIVTITFSDLNLVGATLNGVAFNSGSKVSENGTYTLLVTDKAGNVMTVYFTVKIVPVIVASSSYTYEETQKTGELKSTDTINLTDDNEIDENEDDSSDDGSLVAWLITTAVITVAAIGAGAGGWMFFRKRK